MKTYVHFEEIEKKSKTSVYAVVSESNFQLGIIKWYGSWRQYCFFPSDETVWSRGCLKEVDGFIQNLMAERKRRNKP